MNRSLPPGRRHLNNVTDAAAATAHLDLVIMTGSVVAGTGSRAPLGFHVRPVSAGHLHAEAQINRFEEGMTLRITGISLDELLQT